MWSSMSQNVTGIRLAPSFKSFILRSGSPDYQSCVEISTQASLVEMKIPGTLAICAPLTIGFILGERALGGMLVGGITSGFMLAVYMANSGGAWDNAKKVNDFSEKLSPLLFSSLQHKSWDLIGLTLYGKSLSNVLVLRQNSDNWSISKLGIQIFFFNLNIF